MIAAWLSILLLQASPAAPPPKEHVPSLPYDIVVQGIPWLDESTSAVTSATLGSSKVGNALKTRVAFEGVESMIRCGGKLPTRGLEWLRVALDAPTASARQVFAQQQFVRLNAACAPTADYAGRSGTIAGYYHDRGGLYLLALQRFAGELTLRKSDTADPAVQRRFDRREIPLLRDRLAADRQFIEAAICLVRLQPEFAVRLVQATTRYPAFKRIEAAIVNGARVCTGNARRVYFDPTQFRSYIADALYRWIVAARGVDTLIPAPHPPD